MAALEMASLEMRSLPGHVHDVHVRWWVLPLLAVLCVVLRPFRLSDRCVSGIANTIARVGIVIRVAR